MKIIRALQNAVIDTVSYSALTALLLWLRGDSPDVLISKYYKETTTVVFSGFVAIYLSVIFGATTLRDSLKLPLKGGGKDRMPGTLAVAVIVGFILAIAITIYHQPIGGK